MQNYQIAKLKIAKLLFQQLSVLDSSLRHHALFVGVLYLAHFCHGVGDFQDCRVRISARQDYVYHLRFPLQAFDDLRRIKHAVADGVVNLVQNDKVPML